MPSRKKPSTIEPVDLPSAFPNNEAHATVPQLRRRFRRADTLTTEDLLETAAVREQAWQTMLKDLARGEIQGFTNRELDEEGHPTGRLFWLNVPEERLQTEFEGSQRARNVYVSKMAKRVMVGMQHWLKEAARKALDDQNAWRDYFDIRTQRGLIVFERLTDRQGEPVPIPDGLRRELLGKRERLGARGVDEDSVLREVRVDLEKSASRRERAERARRRELGEE